MSPKQQVVQESNVVLSVAEDAAVKVARGQLARVKDAQRQAERAQAEAFAVLRTVRLATDPVQPTDPATRLQAKQQQQAAAAALEQLSVDEYTARQTLEAAAAAARKQVHVAYAVPKREAVNRLERALESVREAVDALIDVEEQEARAAGERSPSEDGSSLVLGSWRPSTAVWRNVFDTWRDHMKKQNWLDG